MTIGTDSIEMHKGEDVVLDFGPIDPLDDISGWTILMTVKSDTAQQFTAAGVVVDGPNGLFNVPIDQSDTSGMQPDIYQYDIWRTDDGSERVLAIGSFRLKEIARTLP